MMSIILHFAVIFALAFTTNGEYLVGVGSYDMTGPAANINMMGYANINQNTAGIHFRLRARAFIVAEGQQGNRVVFVNLDAGMASQLVTIKVVDRLKSRYGDLYTEENLAISGTHTHAGPGGYLQYVIYSVTSLGFVHQSFDVIVNAIEQSIVQAHNNLRPGSILFNKAIVDICISAELITEQESEIESCNSPINQRCCKCWDKSEPSAYLFNPPEERARYPKNVDPGMTLVKFVDSQTGTSIGAFNWFATHGTSMTRTNKLISGDNKGVAARLLEDWFSSANKTKLTPAISHDLPPIKATGGQPCENTTSRDFKVRKTSGAQFVGAFCQSNVGDVTPNVWGAYCIDTGLPCDFNHSSCNGNNQLCIGRGPGYPDEIKSTRIIGERQFQTAVDLFESAQLELTGKVDFRHTYLNFSSLQVDLGEGRTVSTCPAAIGPGFAAGTTDGPGASGFQQGDNKIPPALERVRDGLKKPSEQQVECQKPKAVLLSTGEMFVPYAWAPSILPIQILRIGKLIILAVPGEFTTMAGRRLREAVKSTLVSSSSSSEFDTSEIVIAGLSNAYSQYVATFEEYQQQRYEAASTLYGPHTLSAYIQEFTKLASTLATSNQPQNKSRLSPPDLSSVLMNLVLPDLGDTTPEGKTFGDTSQDIVLPVRGWFNKGENVTATFYSGNPRRDLLTEGTFALVEMLVDVNANQWRSAYDDDDLSLFFKWSADASDSSISFATIEWEIPSDAPSGVYRLRHFGASVEVLNSTPCYFTGASSAFFVQS